MDTNILIAALINPVSVVWSILEIKDFEFFVPEFFLYELDEYKNLIKEKLDIRGARNTFNFLISELFKNITIIPEELYSDNLTTAAEIMRDIDEKDSPFLALAMTLNCSIWSNDQHFKRQTAAKTYNTDELIREFLR